MNKILLGTNPPLFVLCVTQELFGLDCFKIFNKPQSTSLLSSYVWVNSWKSSFNNFRLTDSVTIFHTYVNLVTNKYFHDIEDLIMTMEEVKDLGSGYSYEIKRKN